MQVKTKIIESLFIKALRRESTFISSTGDLKSKWCFWGDQSDYFLRSKMIFFSSDFDTPRYPPVSLDK